MYLVTYERKTEKMAKILYRTKGTCAAAIELEVEDGIIKCVSFMGGCGGNTQGISKLVEGMKTDEAVARLLGIKCGFKNTSCPDQLAKAILELEKKA